MQGCPHSTQEHIKSTKNNKDTNSNYAHHELETNHTHGTIANTIDIIHITNKGKYTNGIEEALV